MFAVMLMAISVAGTPDCGCTECKCAKCWCADAKVSQLQPPPLPADYLAMQKRVEKGEELIVYAGVPLPMDAPKNSVRINRFPGEKNGVYRCFWDKKAKEGKYQAYAVVKEKPRVELFNLGNVFPSRSDCPNGNCPNARPAAPRWGLFR